MVQRLVDAATVSHDALAELLDPMPRVAHYRLVALIGRGGMARVFAAWDSQSNRPVAIKLFEPKHEEVWSLIQRFQNEANAMGKMKHPHIVSLLDRGNKRGRVYFVMNLVTGSSLSELYHYWRRDLSFEGRIEGQSLPGSVDIGVSDSAWINISLSSSASPSEALMSRDSSGTLLEPLPRCRIDSRRAEIAPSMIPQRFRDVQPFSEEHSSILGDIGRDVCDALRYSHDKGVLHRDIKPSNLLLDEEGKSWVMDFGLASVNWTAENSVDERLTRHGDLLGTIAYMSVGAVEGEYSEQSDLYSLGATLYELATLRPVWCGHHEGEILKKLFDRSLPPLDHLHDGSIPSDLARLIECLLTAETSQAMPTAAQMLQGFEAFTRGESVELPGGTNGFRNRTRQMLRRWYKPTRWLTQTAIWLVLVLAFAAVMGFKLYSEHRVLATKASSLHGSLQRRMDQAVYSVQLLEQFAENVKEFPPDDFAAFAKPVLDNNLEVVSVGFARSIDPSKHENDDATPKFAGHLTTSELSNMSATDVIVTHLESQDDQEIRLMPGSNLMEEPVYRDVIKETSFTGDFAVAGPVMLGERGTMRTAFLLAQRVDRVDKPASFIFVFVRIDNMLKALELPKSEEGLLVRVWEDKILQARAIYEGDQHGVPFKIPVTGANPDFEYDLRVRDTSWKLSMFLANPWSQSNASLLLNTLLFAVVIPLPVVLVKRTVRWLTKRS